MTCLLTIAAALLVGFIAWAVALVVHVHRAHRRPDDEYPRSRFEKGPFDE